MIARPAKPGRYLDTNTPCSDRVLDECVRLGFLGIIRYVNLPGLKPTSDISIGEADRITSRGLGLGLVQHPRFPGWDPAAHNGSVDADASCTTAKAVLYAPGSHLWLDLEGLSPKASRAATIAFAYAWQGLTIAHGFRAGLYDGYDVPLSGRDLYELHGFDSYYSDAGHRRVAVRGCALNQGGETVILGTKFDVNELAADLLGEVPFMSYAA